jgi:hypothetical protein
LIVFSTSDLFSNEHTEKNSEGTFISPVAYCDHW